MDIYAGAVLLSLLVYIAVGNYAGRRVKHLDDYFVAGRRAPTLLIVGTLVASVMSTNAFLGETGFVYDGQAGPYILWPAIAASCYVWGALFFGRYLRRSRAITVADYFGQRFASQRVQTVAGITIIVGLGGYLLAVTQGAAYLLTQLVGLEYPTALVLSWFTYTGFTLYAGTRGVIITDTMMFLLFTSVAFFALVWLVNDAGGITRAVGDLASLPDKAGLMSWTGIVGEESPFSSGLHFALWNLTLAFAWGLVYAVSPWQSSRYLIARDEHVVLRSACLAAVCLSFLEVTLYLGGAVVNLWDTAIEPSHQVMIHAALELLPAVLGAGMLAGIMAAALSSASTFLSLVGFSVSNDLFPHRSMNEQQLLKLSRVTMLGIGLLALGVAFVAPVDLFWLTYFVGTLYASSWGPVALMSVWSRRITEQAAFWGIVSGFVFNAGPKALIYLEWLELPFWLDPILLGGFVSLVVVLGVSRLGRPGRAQEAYRLRLHRVPPEDMDRERSRNTRRTPLAMVAYSLVMAGLFLGFYVPAYRSATGNSGMAEVILVCAGPLVWIVTAAVAWRMIRRSYG